MSFTFEWPRFSDQFHADAIQTLESALNKGNKPPVIADRIEVVELEMGTQPPELEIRDIGDLTMSQFRGIFRLMYAGDAYIVLRTKVQANPLYHKKPDIHLMSGSRGMLAANQPLIVPMLLRLSNFKLNSYVVLVVSKQKGITLVFKTDPLQNVDISSTFDSIAVIQKFIQTEIEGQLRQMFREDLPGIIHRLSQQWVKATTVEAPYLVKQNSKPVRAGVETVSNPDFSRHPAFMSRPRIPSQLSQSSLDGAMRRHVYMTSSRSVKSATNRILTQTNPSLFDDGSAIDDVDEESVQTRSVYGRQGPQRRHQRGLSDLTEEWSEEDNVGLFEPANRDDPSENVLLSHPVEYESFPAVGGGTITRPKLQSFSAFDNISGLESPNLRDTHQSQADRQGLGRSSSSQNPYFPDTGDIGYSGLRLAQSRRHASGVHGQSETPSTSHTVSSRSSSHTLDTPQSAPSSPPEFPFKPPLASRRPSVSSERTNDFIQQGETDDESTIVLRPGLNNAISQLSLLNYSNHTLSPFAPALEHFTVRSVHPQGPSPTAITADRQPAKAKRKRTYRLTGRGKSPPQLDNARGAQFSPPPLSPRLPSEFDVSDVDRYFTTNDDSLHNFSHAFSPHLRRRTSSQTT